MTNPSSPLLMSGIYSGISTLMVATVPVQQGANGMAHPDWRAVAINGAVTVLSLALSGWLSRRNKSRAHRRKKHRAAQASHQHQPNQP